MSVNLYRIRFKNRESAKAVAADLSGAMRLLGKPANEIESLQVQEVDGWVIERLIPRIEWVIGESIPESSEAPKDRGPRPPSDSW